MWFALARRVVESPTVEGMCRERPPAPAHLTQASGLCSPPALCSHPCFPHRCYRARCAVGIHELGHFLAAVTRGIHVTKFSIGFGPTLLKWQASAAPAGQEVQQHLDPRSVRGGFLTQGDC